MAEGGNGASAELGSRCRPCRRAGPTASLPNQPMHGVEHALSLVVLAVVIGVARFGKGFVSNIAVLIGIVVGGCIAARSASCTSTRW